MEAIHGLRLDFTYLARSAAATIKVFSGHASELWERGKERFLYLFYFIC